MKKKGLNLINVITFAIIVIGLAVSLVILKNPINTQQEAAKRSTRVRTTPAYAQASYMNEGSYYAQSYYQGNYYNQGYYQGYYEGYYYSESYYQPYYYSQGTYLDSNYSQSYYGYD